eukprot:314230-Heterocapsa_arctica.AAC.1
MRRLRGSPTRRIAAVVAGHCTSLADKGGCSGDQPCAMRTRQPAACMRASSAVTMRRLRGSPTRRAYGDCPRERPAR